MQIRNTKAAQKKNDPKKPVPTTTTKKKKAPTKLHEFPEGIQVKARNFAEKMNKNRSWRMKAFAQDSLEALPRRKDNITVKEQSFPSVGGYNSDGGLLATLLNNVSRFMETARAKGATEFRVVFRSLDLTARRKETDAEFQKRVDEATLVRAQQLAVREIQLEQVKKGEKERVERLKLSELTDFHRTVKRLGHKKAQKIIDGIRESKGTK